MYCFNNDYSEGAHPRILEAIKNASSDQHTGYSLDSHTEHAKALIKQAVHREDVDIHMLVGGTQTNMLVISAALRPHGKLTPALIQTTLDGHTDEHMVQPKMVYISNTTEIGTQYTLDELEALSRFCRQKGLYLFLDGARLGAALTSPVNDLTLADIARLVDVFYIGGTKNGALFGEALVIAHPGLKEDFRFMIKQKGAMLAKGFLLGIQFEELFQDDLFFQMAAHANQMAAILKEAFTDCGFPFFSDSATNQQFPILPNDLIAKLRESYQFQDQQAVDADHTAVRFVTSWATKEEAARRFAQDLKRLA